LPATVTPPNQSRDLARGRCLQADRRDSSVSLAEIWGVVCRNGRLFFGLVSVLIAGCLVYCVIAPGEYEASGKVELRSAPDSLLGSDRRESMPSGAFATGQVQLETVANVLRSEQLAWGVVTELRLYKDGGFSRSFQRRFPNFNPGTASADEKEYLLRRFREGLTVESLPHTLVLAIRFRSHDRNLSATVVNELIKKYEEQETESRMQSMRGRTDWLNAQLREMRQRVDQDDLKLAQFQRVNGIVSTSGRSSADGLTDVGQSGVATAILEMNRALVNATADRISREAEYRSAKSANPELAFNAEERAGSTANPQMMLLQKLHSRRSELELERARLEIEHGPNFPRVVEIGTEMRDADAQMKEARTQVLESLRSAWKTSVDREEMLRKSLDEATGAGLKLSGAALTYATMWHEANANRETYLTLLQKAEEASVGAGSRGSGIRVIDYARPPAKPASPNVLLDVAITGFVAVWLALAVVLARDAARKKSLVGALLVAWILPGANASYSQAPTPSTSGLPTGVAHIPQSVEKRSRPNPKNAPEVWNSSRPANAIDANSADMQAVQPMAAPIAAGDMLDVAEAHGTELHASVRVSQAGTVVLPLAGEVNVEGMDERAAAHAIEAVLIGKGMLLHPQVTVLVTAYAGQDVSVLGEVTRPGVYNYTVHHRLLDLISAASGLNPNAGRLVMITHRSDPEKAEPVVLDPSGLDPKGTHNPELMPGDTVQVERAGLVYVVGDVIRPGAFPVDAVQAITVVQAVSLAWGPTQNAALKNALLIREQAGGRTVTTLNLKRMLRGLDPDLPVRDRDILFVPDSTARNLLNRSLESVVQSAAGVSIYSGLVYSQRY
jgi:polysaccharide export outer membrane protein